MKPSFVTICLIAQLNLASTKEFLNTVNTKTVKINETTKAEEKVRQTTADGIAFKNLTNLHSKEKFELAKKGGGQVAQGWPKPCESNEGGNGSASSWALRAFGCNIEYDCKVHIDKKLLLELTFRPKQLERDLKMSLTAIPLSPGNHEKQVFVKVPITNPPFDPSQETLIELPVIFPSSKFGDHLGHYALQVRLYSSTTDENIVCQSIPVTLAYQNEGSSLGDPCSTRFESCSFKNSFCVRGNNSDSSLTCQCDYGSCNGVNADKGCKKFVGTYCEQSSECIDNADCQETVAGVYGFCHCVQGYINVDNNLRACIRGSGSSVLGLSFLPVFALLFQIFISLI